jgi:lipopolysaccharide biosynthesis regulator YciM
MVELFWLLLPVAALSGWWIGRRGSAAQVGRAPDQLSKGYLQGLNYLLSEQQDKAIEVFTRMVEVNSETAEVHLALGSLFRRRGEVDRAIRIHQNLIARPTMSREQRAYALLELGQDYMKAGLLDRAESLFEQVVEVNAYVVPALRQLLLIYQQEKDWDRAIAAALRLDGKGVQGMRPMIAHFYCEQAEQALREHGRGRAGQLVKRALSYDPESVRASILQGLIEQQQGQDKAALKAFMRVERQDPEFLPEVLKPIRKCYDRLQQPDGMIRYLERLSVEHASETVNLALADAIRERNGTRAAADFLTGKLRQNPSVRGMAALTALTAEQGEHAGREELAVLRSAFIEMLARSNTYECRQCGFSGRNLHWQCPSCRHWGTVKPLANPKVD